MSLSRRDLLKRSVPGVLALMAAGRGLRADEEPALPPVRQITFGPKHHWFGYYDKLQFDPTGRFVLGMEVDFEHRSPQADDAIRVGMVDLADARGPQWIELGETRAWCWQQGCMLQWRPGSTNEVVWNDREGDRFVCHVLNVETRRRRTIDHPVYCLSPDGRWAATPDFRRINVMRPGYGYAGPADPYSAVKAPDDTGIFRVDLESGKSELIVPISRAAAVPYPNRDLSGMKHYFNHLLISPDGQRLEFLHRWGEQRWSGETRMFTVAADGSDMRAVDQSGGTSHFIWRDPQHILAWSRHASHGDAFYVFEDREGGTVEAVDPERMPSNGHCTYLPIPGNAWILNDTYPDRQRNQNPYLYHIPTRRRIPLGHFLLPKEYTGEWRCDLHPRADRTGRTVCIDSVHTGEGRQLFLIDISEIIEK